MADEGEEEKRSKNIPTTGLSGNDNDFAIAEYISFREEILKRIELRQGILSITLTLAAAIMSLGLIQRSQNYAPNDASVALIYPPIAFCLALAWAQLSACIYDLNDKIRANIQFPKQASCTDFENNATLSGLKFIIYSHGGAFFCTQVLAIAIGCSIFSWHSCNDLQWFLLGIDILSMEAVVVLLYHLRDKEFWDENKIKIKILFILTIVIYISIWLLMTKINGVLPK
ncbi:MAG: hypothetical protein PHY05_11375 [Methanothrix sp.]|nr:hypothetical protein [Methanothrix sp.]